MRIKRYLARDMRQALRMVRDEQGPDAVILSSQRMDDGVEVTAATDYEPPPDRQAPAPGASPVPRARQVPVPGTSSVASDAERRPADPGNHATEMGTELKRLRQMLETQMATLAWNDLTRRAPVQAELLRDLTQIGLAQDLAADIVAQTPRHLESEEAQRQALAQVARRIDVTGDRLIETGGMLALVGATGAGKTTTIAKLAARWVLRHGPKDVALVAADSLRIGAQEQVHTLGRLLGVTACSVASTAELPGVLARLADRRLVLVDTAGYGARDAAAAGELAAVAASHPRVEVMPVLSASVQAGVNDDVIARCAPLAPPACILTKLDESASLGGLLSALIRARLPVAYVSEGQRVPEDLAPARAHQLVVQAVELARRSGAAADEDLLQRRFGGIAHAIA